MTNEEEKPRVADTKPKEKPEAEVPAPAEQEAEPAPEPAEVEAPAEEGGDWFIFERHMRERDENFIKTLNPPATDEEIADAEKTLGVQFPPEYTKLLKIHNGQNDEAKPLFGRYMFSPLSEVLKAADENSIPDELPPAEEVKVAEPRKDQVAAEDESAPAEPADTGERKGTWHKGYIPFAVAPGGDCLVIDTDPGEAGTPGLIATFYKADDKREVQAKDLGEWLGNFIKDELGEVKRPPNAAMEGWFQPRKVVK